MSAETEKFISQVESLNEVDYGDFKRKVNQYLNRLIESGSLKQQDLPVAKEILNRVVFLGPGDVEAGKALTIELAKKFS